jgi:TadE-like protein
MYMPLLVFMIFVTLQLAFLFLGNQAAGAAAREAARVARSAGNPPAGSLDADLAGEVRGSQYAGSVGHGLFDGKVTVQVVTVNGPGGPQVVARVTATAVHLVPGLPRLKIDKKVQGPVEVFHPDAGV